MEIMLAREPIFAPHEQIIGYQISYHECAPEIGEHTVLDALLDHGVDRLTDAGVAFIEVTPAMLLARTIELLDRRGVVLVLDGAPPPAGVLERCEELRARGYHFALSLHPGLEPPEPLLALVEAVRVDVQAFPRAELEELAARLRPLGVHLLGKGVLNTRVRDECLELGFKMFQGYEFTQPELLSRRELSVKHLETFRLLREIANPRVPDAQIVEAFHRNPNLTYKLLRVANSAAAGGHGIESIAHAVRLLGRDSLHRWLSLLLLASVADRGVGAEISSTAILRARLCELLAAASGQPAAADALFTIGLLSRLDLLLNTPLEHILELISLTEEVREALLSRSGPYGSILALVEAYEAGEWEEVDTRCSEVAIATSELPRLYLEALPWARELMVSGGESEPAAAEPSATPAAAQPAAVATEGERRRGGLLSLLRGWLVGWKLRPGRPRAATP